jgi:TRAP-type C4-dicarboxylate transport system permease small subunit
MNSIKFVAIGLIIAGILGLAYGGFSYTKDSTVVKIGTLEISAKEKKTVNIPMWAGIGAIVAGGLLLVMGSKKA